MGYYVQFYIVLPEKATDDSNTLFCTVDMCLTNKSVHAVLVLLCCLDAISQPVFKSTNILRTVCNIMLISITYDDLAWWEPYAVGIH